MADPRAPRDRAREAIDTWNRRDGERDVFKFHWQECADVMQPDRNDYIVTRAPGQKRMQMIFDEFPLWCVDQFAAGMHSAATNPYVQWFGLRADLERVDRIPRVRAWLESSSATMYDIFAGPKHNFASQSHMLRTDQAVIGTACMAALEDPAAGIFYSTRHMKEITIGENHLERVDDLGRRWHWTARQAYEQWGDKVGEKIGKAYKEKPDTKFTFYHAVRPRRDRNPARADRLHKKFESVYVCEQDLEFFVESGFDEFPYMVPRFTKLTGELYGRGPGMKALPAIKMGNELAKIIIKGAQKIIDPPLDMPDDGYLMPLRTLPGSLNYRRAGLRPDDRVAPIATGGQPQIGTDMLEALHNRIGQMFYVDLFRLPTDMENPASDGKGITATYYLHRRDKEMQIMSPLLARDIEEFTDPLINRTFALLMRMSMRLRFGPDAPFDPPPPELSGARLQVEYVSPLAMAQRSSVLDSVDKLMQRQQQLRVIDPTCPNVLNSEGIMRLTSRDTNAPSEALKTSDQLQQEAEAAQQAAQAEQQRQGIESLAGAAKDGSTAVKNFAGLQNGGGVGQQPLQQAA